MGAVTEPWKKKRSLGGVAAAAPVSPRTKAAAAKAKAVAKALAAASGAGKPGAGAEDSSFVNPMLRAAQAAGAAGGALAVVAAAAEEEEEEGAAPGEVVLDEEAEEDRKVGALGRCWQSFCAGCASLPCLVPESARGPLLFAANHWSLGSFMTLLIIGNAVLLACDAAGTSDTYDKQLAVANLIFVGFFTFEMVLKMLALGLVDYMAVPFNVFDAIIVTISIIEAIIDQVAHDLMSGGGTSALRAFRLLRVLKLAKSWKRLNKVLVGVAAVVPTGGASLLVMFIIILVFALMGMQLFGGKLQAFTDAGAFAAHPRGNFDTLWWAIVTSFWVMTNENWDYILHTHMTAFGAPAFIFFVAVVLFGNYVFANMYLAAVLDGSSAGALAQAAAEEAAPSKEATSGGLPALALAGTKVVVRYWGSECRARCPNSGKCFGFCPCDCLEDEAPDADVAKKPAAAASVSDAGAAKGAVSQLALAPLKGVAAAKVKRVKPSRPVELLPVAAPSTSRVDYIDDGKAMQGAILYVPATAEPRPRRTGFEDPEDPLTAPPRSAAGMRIQVLASGDARVIPQAPDRLPCDVPISRVRQFERGQLTTVGEENISRSNGGRAGGKWRRGLSALSQAIIGNCGRANHDVICGCARSSGLVAPPSIDEDSLAQIPDDQLQKEADAANVKLKLFVRKKFVPANLRRPSPHEVLGFIQSSTAA